MVCAGIVFRTGRWQTTNEQMNALVSDGIVRAGIQPPVTAIGNPDLTPWLQKYVSFLLEGSVKRSPFAFCSLFSLKSVKGNAVKNDCFAFGER